MGEVVQQNTSNPPLGWLAAFFKTKTGTILSNAGYAIAIYFGTKWILGSIKGISPETANAIASGTSAGYFAGTLAHTLFPHLGTGLLGTTGIGILIGIAVFVLTFKSSKTENYQFTCYPWNAPTGGVNCEKCNQGTIPCTEYRCRSLGQACILANQGTGDELCVWNNSQDVTPPVIQPWTDVLTTGYQYIPDGSISPPDNGV